MPAPPLLPGAVPYEETQPAAAPVATAPPPPPPPPPPEQSAAPPLLPGAVPYEEAAPQQAAPQQSTQVEQAPPQEAAPSPGLGSGTAYQPEAPPQSPPPPPPGETEWYSGATDALGRVAQGLGDAAGAAARLDPAGVGSALIGISEAPYEYEAPRQAERAVEGRPLTQEEIKADPSVAWDVTPTASASPSLIDTNAPGLLSGILPEGAPGPLNAVGDALGAILTTDLSAVSQQHGGPTLDTPMSMIHGAAAGVVGSELTDFAQAHPEIPQDQIVEAWKQSGGASSAPPVEWINPFDQGMPESPGDAIKRIADMGGGVKDSIQSGSIEPFLKGMAVDITMDPTLPGQALVAGAGEALGVTSRGLGAAGAASRAAGRPVIGAALEAGAKVTGVGSKGARLINEGIDVVGGDPTPIISAGVKPIRNALNPMRAVDAVTAPSAEGLTGLQIKELQDTGGQYLDTRQGLVNSTPTAGPYLPTMPGPLGTPARLSPGANGRLVPDTTLEQPDIVHPMAEGGLYAPTAPGTVTRAPSTGKPVVPETVPRATYDAMRRHLDSLGQTDVGLRIVESLGKSPDGTPNLAAWHRNERLIALTTDSLGDAPRFLDHEAIHAIRDSGLFTDKEWGTLVKAAEDQGIRDFVSTSYADVTDQELFAQEMVAELYNRYRSPDAAGAFTPETRTLLQRLVDFLKSFGRATYESYPAEVLKRIDNGEIGSRTRQETSVAREAAYSRFQATTYHGSQLTDLDQLVPGNPGRTSEYASSSLGVFTTPNRRIADMYVPSYLDGEGISKEGRLYEVGSDLNNAYDMSQADMNSLYTSTPRAHAAAEELKARLLAEGHDGIIVWPSDHPRITDPSLKGTPVTDAEARSIGEVVHFEPQMAFARRERNPIMQEMRDAVTNSGVDIFERDPTFIDRFRNLIDGQNPAQIVETLDKPFMESVDSLTGEITPNITELNPNFRAESIARLEADIEWARTVYDFDAEGNEIRNKKGLTPVDQALAAVKKKGGELSPPPPEIYDKVLRLPMGHLMWYDLSGKAFDEMGMPTPDAAREFIDLLAATSGGEQPLNNMKLAMAVKAMRDQNRPGFIGLRDEVSAERILQGADFETPKFDNFSRNLASQSLLARQTLDSGALPTIDMWQFRSYNVPPDTGAAHPALFAIIAKHTIEEGDALQALLGNRFVEIDGVPTPMEHRFMQAGVWVLGRENKGLYGKELKIPSFKKGSDYWSALQKIGPLINTTKLRAARLGEGGTGERIDPTDFMNPELPDALTNFGITNFEQSRHILMEFANTNTLAGVDAAEMWHNMRRLHPDSEAAFKFMNGWSGVKGVAKIHQGVFADLMKSKAINKMAGALMGENKFALSRINQYSWGSWGDSFSPNIDIPTNGYVGTKRVTMPADVVERVVYGLAQAFRQDGAAWSAWNLDAPPERMNARQVLLPDTHLEQAGKKTGRQVLPEEIERLAKVAEASGWPTQVVASPSNVVMRLIDPGDPAMVRLSDADLHQKLIEMGYTGEVHFVEAEHRSVYADAQEGKGYGDYITNPESNPNLPASGIRPETRMPIGSRVGEGDWGGFRREQFRAAVTLAREVADRGNAELAKVLPRHRLAIEAALRDSGLEWETPSDLQDRRAELTELGGESPDFPLTETAFARRSRHVPSKTKAAGFLSAEAQKAVNQWTGPTATLGYHGHLLNPNVDAAMREKFDFTFNDKRMAGAEVGQVFETVYDDLLVYIHMTRDPSLQIGNEPQYADLVKRFANEDGSPLDVKNLGGPGDKDHQHYLRTRITQGVVGTAYEKGLPKAAKGKFSDNPVSSALDEYSRIRQQTQLFNVFNIPRYFTQNWLGNTISNVFNAPGAVPSMLRRLTELGNTYGVVEGRMTDHLDDMMRDTGMVSIGTVETLDKAQLGRMTNGKLPPPRGRIEAAMRKTMNPRLTALSQTGDIAQRRSLAEAALEDSYRVLNSTLPKIVRKNMNLGVTRTKMAPLNISDGQVTKAVGEFLDARKTSIDGNTGKIRTNKLGVPVKRTPMYKPKEFSDFMEGKLRDLDPKADSRLIKETSNAIWADVEANQMIIRKKVGDEVDRVAFSWIPTNASEAMRKFVMFPYWTYKQGTLWMKFMATHPVAAATYGRMMDDMEDQAEQLNAPDWFKGFFRIMNSPAGMSVWFSPLDLVQTFFTFPDYIMENGGDPYKDMSEIGHKISDIPFLVNPIVGLGFYATGMGGPDFPIPDMLGLNRLTGTAASLIDAANFAGLLPGALFKDEYGRPTPVTPKPVDQLVARFGHEFSSILSPITGEPAVPVPPWTPIKSRDLAAYAEQIIRSENPNMSQEEVLRQANAAMTDPDSDIYRRAGQMMAQGALTTGLGIDTILPDGFDAAIDAMLRLSSPVQFSVLPETTARMGRLKGLEPSGTIPSPNFAEGEAGEREFYATKDFANQTIEAREFNEEVNGFFQSTDPDGLGAIKKISDAIYYSGEPNKYKNGEITMLEEDVSIGGQTWTPEEVAALTKGEKSALADQYRTEQGVTFDQLKAFGETRKEESEKYLAAHPMVDSYLDWKNDSKNTEYYPTELDFVRANMAVNPAYAEYVVYEASDPKTGEINTGYALNTDAFLAAQGVSPTVFSPIHDVALSGQGMAPLGITPEAPKSTVIPTDTVNLRADPSMNNDPVAVLDPTVGDMTVIQTDPTGEWTQVTNDEGLTGWIASEFVGPGSVQAPPPPVMGGIPDAIGSLMSATGSVIGTMFGGGTPTKPGIGEGTGYYDVVPANDGMGVQSTDAADRTWMENMLDGHAVVTTDYKGPPPAGVSYEYQNGHGADGTTHAAYDIGCDDPPCWNRPIASPVSGTVVCSGYGEGTGGSIQGGCTYSEGTTTYNDDGTPAAHTIVIEVGRDKQGNPVQLSFNHMGTSNVTPGQKVQPGDVIGGMGNGDCLAGPCPHTHLEGWVADPASGYTIIDPTLIVGGYYTKAVPQSRMGTPTLDFLEPLSGFLQ